ncbi:MAG: DedA family protein [Alphaproteobacteria bacterium]|jgi:membrane protein YqaA with SNARE-associated domain|nr:DedA family protein [Alphaproteobacteria bacterium]MBT5828442.1 DedA family protein [Alphaproteobacteria bacterium]
MSDLSLLFISAFLAATIFPAQSELLFAKLFTAGGHHDYNLFLSATSGNVLGAVVNWLLGFGLIYKIKPPSNKYKKIFNKYGTPCLLFSWLPIIGDGLTLIAGYYKINFFIFLALVTIGKASRYLVLIYFLKQF